MILHIIRIGPTTIIGTACPHIIIGNTHVFEWVKNPAIHPFCITPICGNFISRQLFLKIGCWIRIVLLLDHGGICIVCVVIVEFYCAISMSSFNLINLTTHSASAWQSIYKFCATLVSHYFYLYLFKMKVTIYFKI